MRCNEAKKAIEAVFEGLEPGEKALSHIRSCKKCSAEYAAAKEIRAALRVKNTPVPAGFNRAVWEKIGEPAPSLFAGFFRTVPVLAAAMAAVLAVIGLSAILNIKQPSKETAAVKSLTGTVDTAEKTLKQPVRDSAVPEPKQADAQEEKIAAAPETAVPETGSDVKPGNMPVLLSSKGAEKEFIAPKEESKIGLASIEKTPFEAHKDLVIKNNVIRPLMGEAMSLIYKVEENCDVIVRVYNRKGEPVRTLYNGSRSRGIYEEKWRGEDDNGTIVGDGVYIAHVKTCLTEQRIKAVVVK
ncbi:MAG TPA: FlgD immunoglobulin-like domain containing protein [Candidatus Goldiibacteriota bacterium]|nr:FlgD immunoglobulin-like domain containing protein [Candidatus Goldiibacteriota bacterium]